MSDIKKLSLARTLNSPYNVKRRDGHVGKEENSKEEIRRLYCLWMLSSSDFCITPGFSVSLWWPASSSVLHKGGRHWLDNLISSTSSVLGAFTEGRLTVILIIIYYLCYHPPLHNLAPQTFVFEFLCWCYYVFVLVGIFCVLFPFFPFAVRAAVKYEFFWG